MMTGLLILIACWFLFVIRQLAQVRSELRELVRRSTLADDLAEEVVSRVKASGEMIERDTRKLAGANPAGQPAGGPPKTKGEGT